MPLYTLHIKVVEGHNLLAADSNGFSDPYATITVDKEAHKTKIIKKSLNPKWNETFSFAGLGLSSMCTVRVHDWDRFKKDDFLGSVELDLKSYVDGRPKCRWHRLCYYHHEKGHLNAGEILLVVHLAPDGQRSLVETVATDSDILRTTYTREGVGQLLVEVVAGKALAVKDISGSSDPYCVISVGENVCKTNIMEKTLDPIWNESFHFLVTPAVAFFSVKLFDWDLLTHDDPMGIVHVDMADLADEKLSDKWWEIKPQTNEKVTGLLHLRMHYTSPKNSQLSSVIAKENYLALSLILDKNFPLAYYVVKCHEAQELLKGLVHFFTSDKKIMPFLHDCYQHDIEFARDENSLLIGEDASVKATLEYFKRIDQVTSYFNSTIMPVIHYIIQNPANFEVEPQRSDNASPKQIAETTQRLLNLILSTKVPAPFREVMAAVRRHVAVAYPALQIKAVSNIFFLRFICSAIFAPETFGLLREAPNAKARRALTLVAKVVHNFANGELFGIREQFMIPFNELIATNKPKLDHFMETATSYPIEGDEGANFAVDSYSDQEKIDNMALVVKHLFNNFPLLVTQVTTTHTLHSSDPVKIAEAKLYFDELNGVFGKYQNKD